MKTFTYYTDENPSGYERIHIGKSTITKGGEISGRFRIIEFKVRNRNRYVCFIPSLSITAQGKTKEFAILKLKRSLDKFCRFLAKLPESEVRAELIALGWENHRVFKKNYSYLHIDPKGMLQSFNIKKDEITTEVLELIS